MGGREGREGREGGEGRERKRVVCLVVCHSGLVVGKVGWEGGWEGLISMSP